MLKSIALHEKDRVRASAFRLIAKNISRYQKESPTDVKHHLFQAACNALFTATTKGDVRVAAAEALKALQNELWAQSGGNRENNCVYLWVSDTAKQEEIRRITCGSV